MEEEEKQSVVSGVVEPVLVVSDVEQVFAHWKTVMNHARAQLDPKRRIAIQKALKLGYSVQDLREAIDGCSITPHNCGDNERGQRYDSLDLILRSADQIDRFQHNYHCPPKPLNEAERRFESNAHSVAQAWLSEPNEQDVYERH